MFRVGLILVLVVSLGSQTFPAAMAMVSCEGGRLTQEVKAAGRRRALRSAGQRRRGERRRGRRSAAGRRKGKKWPEVQRRRQQRQASRLRRVVRCLRPVMKRAMRQAIESESTQAVNVEAATGAVEVRQTETEMSAPAGEANVLGQFEQRIEIVVVKPDYNECRCPECGGATKRVKWYYTHPWDANLDHATVLEVYREVRRCKKRCGAKPFAPELDFVEPDGRYTKRVKHIAVASVIEDGMVVERVPARMKRDFHLPKLSVTSVHTWVHEAAGKVPPEGEYTRWVVERFSGVIGLDEVVLRRDADGKKKYLTVAVDALNHRTIVFDLLDSRDHGAMVRFLEKLKDMGIRPEVIITDMWKSYAGAIAEVFPEARQQLCVFHVIQDVMRHVNKAFLTYRRKLPKETKAQKAIRKELLDFRYTLLTSAYKLSPAQRERIEDILCQHAGTLLAEAYHLKEAVLTLFRISRTPAGARQRRDQIIQRFGHIPELKAVIKLLSGESFEKMIVYLEYENLDKTNNDVERTNRTYQQGEKHRYRARTDETRLNYVKLQARQRNRRNADCNERLKRKPPPPACTANVDTIAQTTAHSLAA